VLVAAEDDKPIVLIGPVDGDNAEQQSLPVIGDPVRESGADTALIPGTAVKATINRGIK
jgi:hypothetical protein